ncbi:putative cysteine desulfurase NifS [subsurface metagenome]
MGLVYLDWASTAPPDPEILDRTREVSGRYFGNPSSIHRAGREAEKILAHSRQLLSTALSCREDEIIFTSGGTEANNMVLFSLLGRGSGKKVILSGIEHASLYQPAIQ